MTEFYEGRIVWITGASSGIGAALAIELSRRGARLILSARRQPELERVRSQCAGGPHEILVLDTADEAACRTAAHQVLEQHGKVDILVNNAGISQRSRVRDTDFEVDRRIMQVNFFAPVILTKALLPSMLERGAGHVVTISSVVGKFGTPLRSAYAASKHAIHGWMDTLRAEVWRDGIRVTLICPGFVKTDVTINALTADGTPRGLENPKQVRGLTAEQCARRIADAVAKQKEEVYIGGWEVLAVYVKRWFPGLFSRLIRRYPGTG